MTTWVGQVESSAALASKEAIICHRMCQQQCLSFFFVCSILNFISLCSSLPPLWFRTSSCVTVTLLESFDVVVSVLSLYSLNFNEMNLFYGYGVWRDAGDWVRSKLLPALIHWNYVSPMPRFKSSLALRSLVLVVKTKQTKNCVYFISKFKIHHLKRAHTRALPRISLQCTSLTYILCSKTAHIELCLCSEWSEIEIN